MSSKRLAVLSLVALGLVVFSTPSFGQYFPYYMLDGYGGVHAGGGAPAISPTTYYFGWDIAKSIEFFPVAYSSAIHGDAVLVLDGYGGVHKGGKLSGLAVSATPYFGWNIARGIVARWFHPQANYSTLNTDNLTITSTAFASLQSVTLVFPNDGYALVSAGCSMGNNSTAGFVRACIALGLDSTTDAIDNIEREIGLKQWVEGQLDQWGSVNLSQMKYVTAGYHTFYFLAKKQVATDPGTISYYDPTISVVFIDRDAYGFSGSEFEDAAGAGERWTGTIKQ